MIARFATAALAGAAAFGLAALPRTAMAIPYFAHEYGLTCQKCHSVIPRLNEFGLSFMDHGYSLPGATPQPVFPLSMKFNLAYSSQPDPSGLPKGIVDEVEIFLAGKMSPRTNYFIEQYVVDGGVPGAIREAWIANRFTPDEAKIPVYLQAGSFTLPLPVDPETLRETAQHYTLFDQTVGANPFNFFDPKNGIEARAGYADHGLSVRLAAFQGHDKQSGIPTLGLDRMLEVQQVVGPLTLSAYRYDGSRPVALAPDRFWRQGYGLTYVRGRWESDTVLQTGNDSNFNGARRAALSSGGFTQLRYEFDRRLFALARYEGTCDPSNGFARDLVGLLGYRVSRNSRFTIEDVVQHAGPTTNTLNMQYTAAY
jgi:hypothetical protein